ncbi:MAG: hypothetical protein ACYCPD_08065 [Acidobacteriaceae bacterium]
MPKISVILPVRNGVRSIGRLLDQLLQQTYPADRFEILVADGRAIWSSARQTARRLPFESSTFLLAGRAAAQKK